MKPPLVVLVGPTASGKSALAVELALRFGGEVVSADSRQVYTGLTIGSGKIASKETRGVLHHCLDIASPRRTFTVAQYKEKAQAAIADIHAQGRLPFLVGGSPFYVYAVVDDMQLPHVPPNTPLRDKLAKQSTPSLFRLLEAKDPERAATIEPAHKRRLIRALEIIEATGKPVPKLTKHTPYTLVMLGVRRTPTKLALRIHARLQNRLRSGMLAEVRRLHAQGLSWKRLEGFGLEYRYVALFLQKKLSRTEMEAQLEQAILGFVKTQMRWFRKDPRIHWISSASQASRLITPLSHQESS